MRLQKNLKQLSNKSQGFTIVEVLVTITVVVVLATITTLTLVGQQKETRDTTRDAKANVMAESLEKYYEENGEYPSVASLVNQPVDTIKKKLNVADKDALIFPNAADSTKVSLVTASAGPSPTQVVYVGSPNTPTCQTDPNGYCTGYQLRYETEAEPEVVTLKSRRNPFTPNVETCSGSDCLAAPSRPAVTGAANGSSLVRFSITTASTCTTGTVEYKIRHNTSSANESSMPDWNTISWSSGTTKDVSKGSATNFYSQARARCILSGESGPVSANSVIHTYTVPSTPPPAAPNPSITGSSTSSLTVSWPAVSGATSYSVSATGGSNSCTNSPCTITGLSSSSSYTIYVYASNAGGTSSPGSTTGSTQSAGSAPSTPNSSASATSSSAITLTWPSVSGATSYNVTGTNATSCTSSPCYITGLSSSTSYTFGVRAHNAYGSSGYGYATATTYAPPVSCTAPSTPSLSASPTSTTSINTTIGSSSGTSTISYTLEYGTSTAYGSSMSVSPSTSRSISFLSKNTRYYFRLTASNSCGSASNTTFTNTYSDLSLSVATFSGSGSTTATWSGANIPSGSNTTIDSGRGGCSSTGTSCVFTVSHCGGGASYQSIGASNTVGSAGSTTANWPSQPNISFVDIIKYSNGIRLKWSTSGPVTYHQGRYARTDGTNGPQTSGDGIAASSDVYTFSGLASNKEYSLQIYASNCRYKQCDTFNSSCGGNWHPSAASISRTAFTNP